jgi:rod shape-determining protein MreC
LFQRHLSSVVLAFYTLFCVICLSRSADPFVRVLKHTFFYLLSPATVPVMAQADQTGRFGENLLRLIRVDRELQTFRDAWQADQLDRKRLRGLEEENERLAALLRLSPRPAFVPLAGRVWARDSSDWFHSVWVSRGRRDGVQVSDPVVALQGGREVLVGRVTEVKERICLVLLVTDALSAVSARLTRTGEQGAVEGLGRHALTMNYLFPDSDVQAGDEVVTAGVGEVFPEGIFVGTVEGAQEQARETFKQARIRPAVRLSRLEEVVLLRRARTGDPLLEK